MIRDYNNNFNIYFCKIYHNRANCIKAQRSFSATANLSQFHLRCLASRDSEWGFGIEPVTVEQERTVRIPKKKKVIDQVIMVTDKR